MIRLLVVKKYFDIELKREVLPKEEIEVDMDRAKKLTSMALVEITRIDKLSSKKNGKTNDPLQKGK